MSSMVLDSESPQIPVLSKVQEEQLIRQAFNRLKKKFDRFFEHSSEDTDGNNITLFLPCESQFMDLAEIEYDGSFLERQNYIVSIRLDGEKKIESTNITINTSCTLHVTCSIEDYKIEKKTWEPMHEIITLQKRKLWNHFRNTHQ